MSNKTFKVVTYFLAIAFIIAACSVSKRHYRRGYHVEWFAQKEVSKAQRENASANAAIKKSEPLLFNGVNKNEDAVSVPLSLMAAPQYTNPECDVMIFRAGEEIEVKVIEVLNNSVKYKYCERLDGPTYETLKKDIFMVKYANGTREVFDAAKVNSSENTNINNSPTNNNGPIINSAAGNQHKIERSSGDRSWIAALIMCILVGWLGVHRLYLGDYTMGILYMTTFGLCFIGVIVDIILLATGSLEPEEGYFTDGPYNKFK